MPTLLLVVLLATLLPAAPMAAQAATRVTAPLTGSFVAVRIDRSALPLADRVTDADGTAFLVQFEHLVLSLRAGNRFRASVRFRRTLTTADGHALERNTPIQTMNVSGSYVVQGSEIQFTPDSASNAQGLHMLAGTVIGPEQISVPFDYRNGAVERHRVLELHRRQNIF